MLTQAKPWLQWQQDRYTLVWLLLQCITEGTATTKWLRLTQVVICPISVSKCMAAIQWRTCNQETITSPTWKGWKQYSHMLLWRVLSRKTQAPYRKILSSRKSARVKELSMSKEAVGKQKRIRLRGELPHTLVVEMITNREIKVARRA